MSAARGEMVDEAPPTHRSASYRSSRGRITSVLFAPLDADATPAPGTGEPSAGTAATVAALILTLGLAAAAWVVAVRRMTGMDMGVATGLGSFGFFVALWVPMMAAMMLPGAAPAVARWARASRRPGAVALFLVSYLAVWTLVGLVVYPLYEPHATLLAGAVVIAAGLYELTPLKRRFRLRSHERLRNGFDFGICCVGSSIGLMAIFVVLGVMSITWMAVIGLVVLAQKVLPVKVAVDVPLALAIIAFGILIVLAPSSVPGLLPAM